MDKIDKALRKLRPKEKELFKILLVKIKQSDVSSLDVKKLKGRNDIYRVRKGEMRIIFRKQKNGIKILTLEKRDSKTYSQYIFKI
ncbi:MAG: hypothetical protein A2445_02685 [Candidatus Jacksonbacteria bacterium RIFOXYC2_FULL_44_29]|nr:MAG: RelE/StbE replicon stabilization toxin [Parcubacteria group bacterium GW2011_GWA2_42_28]KKT55909.1 MAG: RelE/StbE replicon stabilization toxin [Parcubacteria group bacterium GW2011_GWC2_44_22]OGY74523.1 MAG: hypothetical protein A2240_02940 [Candidatus Jacksonbacteria bacterium RIFOXYA2_FULL_43_12]OGY77432.1 MAG: hypothetical protein A2295_01890 [Candidatus Jacksonbacteria bacterium RIFOXYB2_FULL_44_15]OGY78204.1 MAG: hypothetical protein A2550_06235 [Candidatus Jacksonbacteria bacteriu